MKIKLLVALLLLAGCAAPPAARLDEPDSEGASLAASGQQVWAYHAAWMGEAWRVYDLRAFGRLLFFDLPVGKDGRIANRNGWPERWEEFRARAREARVPVNPVVTVLAPDVFTAIFANPEARGRLLAEAVALARDAGGVHLDVEVFDPVVEPAIAGYRAFLAALRAELDRPPRRTLTAFVPVGVALYGPGELALLDAVVAQGYDLHWRNGATAGPVATLQGPSPVAWQTAAGALVAQGVPPRRILFSTPLYGYEWPTVSPEPRAAARGPGAIITYAPVPASLLPDIRGNALARAAEHGLRREAGTLAPWYAYRDGGGWRQGWFDDAASLAPRLDFVRAGDYRGVALFLLGYDGGALLEAIASGFRAESEGAAGAGRQAGR
jgi:hypothetical protein